ncbi:hypothetical protein K4L06_20890 [Lysobacter sp. BMK333-48F3]|uniref:hypothetical protein n=1 Tax=Lysobacter sp. BMK333-48F3 TaxID=2867962 RepID=UPI001C8C74DC|nr:hypothetical protein [Lysobacter sp. BMK333-48F3]MBX9403769.1 hypothetical protein [Lysobacter sp. BMK333-48F3]
MDAGEDDADRFGLAAARGVDGISVAALDRDGRGFDGAGWAVPALDLAPLDGSALDGAALDVAALGAAVAAERAAFGPESAEGCAGRWREAGLGMRTMRRQWGG